jgi:hypothetical protein
VVTDRPRSFRYVPESEPLLPLADYVGSTSGAARARSGWVRQIKRHARLLAERWNAHALPYSTGIGLRVLSRLLLRPSENLIAKVINPSYACSDITQSGAQGCRAKEIEGVFKRDRR